MLIWVGDSLIDESLCRFNLRLLGYNFLPRLAAQQLEDVRAHFSKCKVFYDAHVPVTASHRAASLVDRESPVAVVSECICVPMRDAITAPHVFERALELTDVVADFLGRDPPLCYSANAFWTRSGIAPPRKDIQLFHRDEDDSRFLAMFVMLTDTTLGNGAQEIEGPDGKVRCIYGPAGTVFLADTRNPHRGLKPTFGERGLMWFRWGVSDPPASYIWDKNEPIDAALLGGRYPSDPRLRESLKLLVRQP